jgi:peptide chain release factor
MMLVRHKLALCLTGARSLSVWFTAADVVEHLAKGSGPGGQGVNKSENCVTIMHKATGIAVKCHRFRSLTDNRREAQRLLDLKLDEHLNGRDSKLARARERVRKQKQKARKRSAAKYHRASEESERV